MGIAKEVPQKALEIASKSLDVAKGSSDREGQANAYLRFSAARRLGVRLERKKPSLKLGVNLEDAVADASSALALFQEIGNTLGEARALNEVAHLGLARDLVHKAKSAVMKIFALLPASTSMIRLSALATLVEVHSAENDLTSALQVAMDEHDKIVSQDNKWIEAKMLEILLHVHFLRDEPERGLTVSRRRLEIAQSIRDAHLEAVSLLEVSELLVQTGRTEEALTAAQGSLALFKQRSDAKGEATAKRTLSNIYITLDKVGKVPNRVEALNTLKSFVNAVKGNDKDAAIEYLSMLEQLGGYTTSDMEEHLQKLNNDGGHVTQFLRSIGVDIEPYVDPPLRIKCWDPQVLHLAMRVHGMGYGPTFQCGHPHRLEGQTEQTTIVLGMLETREDADWDFSSKIKMPLGLFDSALQTSSAFGWA